jgi:hypothetical protein
MGKTIGRVWLAWRRSGRGGCARGCRCDVTRRPSEEAGKSAVLSQAKRAGMRDGACDPRSENPDIHPTDGGLSAGTPVWGTQVWVHRSIGAWATRHFWHIFGGFWRGIWRLLVRPRRLGEAGGFGGLGSRPPECLGGLRRCSVGDLLPATAFFGTDPCRPVLETRIGLLATVEMISVDEPV